jgi:hypothetical protein
MYAAGAAGAAAGLGTAGRMAHGCSDQHWQRHYRTGEGPGRHVCERGVGGAGAAWGEEGSSDEDMYYSSYAPFGSADNLLELRMRIDALQEW